MATSKSGPGKGNRTRGKHRVGNLAGNRKTHPKSDSKKMAFKIRTATAQRLSAGYKDGSIPNQSEFVSDAIDEKLLKDDSSTR